MRKVRFAPSPTGSLHVGNALSAVANRAFGDWMLLRIDDTDPARNVPAGEEEILSDLVEAGVSVGDQAGARVASWPRASSYSPHRRSRISSARAM